MSESKVQALYAKYCQELGHLQNNRRKIDARVAELERSIDALDTSLEITKAVEAEQKLQALSKNKAAQNEK